LSKKIPAAGPADDASLWGGGWRRFCRHQLALASLLFLALISLLCVLGVGGIVLRENFGFGWPYGYEEQDLTLGPTLFSSAHWLGTDLLGRDLLTRLLVGGFVSLTVGFLATGMVVFIGVTYGMVAGYAGGRLDRMMMRVVDILYALPFTIFIILLVKLLDQPVQKLLEHYHHGDLAAYFKLGLLFLAIGAFEWLNMARVVRARTLELKTLAFVEAARALGRTPGQILRRHLLPNLAGLVVIYASLSVPAVILLESFISFLGLGVQPPLTSWGDLINQGAANMELYPWLLFYPSLVFSLTLFSLNFIGDGLRDALDPRSGRDDAGA
jgi:oligopeptide transport system permease protein